MPNILALDLSKSSTGWALLEDGADRPRFGHWQLGSEYTPVGQTLTKLRRNLTDMHVLTRFEHIFFEKPLTQKERGGNSTEASQILNDLAAYVTGWAWEFGMRTLMPINVKTWRRGFVGPVPANLKGPALKNLVRDRCRHYGFKPRNSDESDALGILDYGCTIRGVVPPWRLANPLIPQLAIAR